METKVWVLSLRCKGVGVWVCLHWPKNAPILGSFIPHSVLASFINFPCTHSRDVELLSYMKVFEPAKNILCDSHRCCNTFARHCMYLLIFLPNHELIICFWFSFCNTQWAVVGDGIAEGKLRQDTSKLTVIPTLSKLSFVLYIQRRAKILHARDYAAR